MNIFSMVIDFLVIAVLIYWVLYFIRGTKAASILIGVVILIGIGMIITSQLKLSMVGNLLQIVVDTLPVVLIFLFQPELRRMFAQAGSFFRRPDSKTKTVDEVVDAAFAMAEEKTGALIVFERSIGLAGIINASVPLDAKVDSMLLQNIFFKNSPLHDGAVIIRENSIVAAKVVLPLAQGEFSNQAQKLGTRHRAAAGITEETDAVALVVSEQTGFVTIFNKGRMERGLSKKDVRRKLGGLLAGEMKKKKIPLFLSKIFHSGNGEAKS